MRSGFIIVEWMIQFLLCTFIGILAFALFRSWSTSLSGLHKALDGTMQLPIACDVLRCDLQKALPTAIRIEPERCTIKAIRQRITWQFKKGILTRAVSNYDTKEGRWKKSVKNLAAERVGSMKFSPIKSSETHEISGVKLLNERDQIIYVIALRNGKVL